MMWARHTGIALALSLVCACSTALPDRTEHSGSGNAAQIEDVPVLGYTVGIRLEPGDESIAGELIAVDDEHVWVMLEESEGTVVVLPHTQIVEVAVNLHAPRTGGLITWTTLGALSTISHGIVSLLSVPVWSIAGTSVTTSDGVSAWGRVGRDEFSRLFQYARFPAGPPPFLYPTPRLGADGLSAPGPQVPNDLPPIPPPPR